MLMVCQEREHGVGLRKGTEVVQVAVLRDKFDSEYCERL
jgi:hypothetical protein